MPSKKSYIAVGKIRSLFEKIDSFGICMVKDIDYNYIESIECQSIDDCFDHFVNGLNHYFLIGKWGSVSDLRTRVLDKDGRIVKYVEQRYGTSYIDLSFSRTSVDCIVEIHYYSKFIDHISNEEFAAPQELIGDFKLLQSALIGRAKL